jgi:Calpain family cysteine protease
MWVRLSQLDPRAVDYVVLGLSDDQLTLLDRLVSTSIGERQALPPGIDSGLDRFDLADFHTLFLANASVETLRRLDRCWRSITPTVRTADHVENRSLDRPRWRRPDNTALFDGEPSADDIDQGALGDCWMQAKLAALAQDDPGWVRDHVRRNPNGTVTVTLYDDGGDPHEVTVTDTLPLDASGEPVFSGDDGTGARWADYYEKAFALVSDHRTDGERGYGGIERGWAADDAQLMTGHEPGDIDDEGGLLGFGDSHPDLDDIRERVADGDPVVVATTDESLPPPFAPNHVFYVEGFGDDGDVVLGNPWSRDTTPLILDEERFNRVTHDAATLNHD